MLSVIFKKDGKKRSFAKTRLPLQDCPLCKRVDDPDPLQNCRVLVATVELIDVFCKICKISRLAQLDDPDRLQKMLYQTVLISAGLSMDAIYQTKKIEVGSSG